MVDISKGKLSNKIIDILEEHNFALLSIEEQEDMYYAELEVYSPMGEDFIFIVWFDGTEEDFIRKFKEDVNDFDEEEHAEMWIKARGTVSGVPDHIRDLIQDAEDIKKILQDLANDLEGEIKGNNIYFDMDLLKQLFYELFEVNYLMADLIDILEETDEGDELLQGFYIKNIQEEVTKESLLCYKEIHSFSCLNRLSEKKLNGFINYIFE